MIITFTIIIGFILFYFAIYPMKLIQLVDYIIVPFNLQSERLFILRSAKKIFKELKLKPIPIVYDNDNSCYYSPKGKFIGIGYTFMRRRYLPNEDWYIIFDYIKAKFKSRRDKLFFIVAHEIAHYLQFTRYPKWSKRVRIKATEAKLHADHRVYRLLKLEATADKIALIVSKKFGYALDK